MSIRTITVFLGSSEELINDRNSFSDLIRALDDIYEPRGIRVKLKRCENFLAYCTGNRTQDDYNRILAACDISVCMFHRKAGKFTIEEFEKSNNPILEFFDELDESDYLHEPVKAVYSKYNSFCLGNNLQAISALEFQKQMKKQYNLVVKIIESNGKKTRVYEDE